jgi:hypothetical protein
MSTLVAPVPPVTERPTPATAFPATATPSTATPTAATPTSPNDVALRRTVLGFVATRRTVEIILTVLLGVGSGLLFFGANFGLNMVHSQLTAQDISFPAKGSAALNPKEFPALQQYAGQKVDTGDKAKAYANDFIDVHLAAVAGGQTYSQVSAESIAAPTNTKLAGEVATLFKGETLRGLLLYAWGWSVVSTIALYAAFGALIGFLVMLVATIGDFVADPRIAAHHIHQA